MKLRLLLIMSLTAALSGCATGPAPIVRTPPPELPGRYFFAPQAAEGSIAALLPVKDPAFAKLSQRALENSPTLGEALARVDEARANAARADADRLPDIGVDASVTGTRTNPEQFGTALPPGIEIDPERVGYAANLTARWDVDLFGRLRAQQRAARARIDASTASAQAVRIALVGEIAATIIDWRTVDARQAALNDDLVEAKRIAALTESRVRAGLVPGLDRFQSQSVIETAQTRLIALETDRSRLLGRLVTLTAQNADEVQEALAQQISLTAWPAPAAPPSVPATLLQNRPDILSAAASLEAEDAELAAAARRRFPTFRLDAAIGLLSFGIGNLFDAQSVVGSLAASVAGPLLDFGRISAEMDTAAAGKRIAFQAYRGTVYTALGEAEAAYGGVDAADREALAAQREMLLLDRTTTLSETRYRAGLSNFSNVAQARRNLLASRERSVAAYGRAARARVVLWQALGGAAGAHVEPRFIP